MCSYCGMPMASDRKPGFNDTCETCGKDLHACVNCRFYRRGARWDCLETSLDGPVADKEARNYCEWYETRPELFAPGQGRASDRGSADTARGDFDKLFGT
ncbi:MAG: hypothetical protein M0Z80_00780 [Treponema sp.]|nr:hypothetical protein [Treponema sp.]